MQAHQVSPQGQLTRQASQRCAHRRRFDVLQAGQQGGHAAEAADEGGLRRIEFPEGRHPQEPHAEWREARAARPVGRTWFAPVM